MSLSTFRARRSARRPSPPAEPVVITPPTVFPAVLRGTSVVQSIPLEDEHGARYGWDLLVRVADISQHPGTFVSQIPAIAGAYGTVDAGVSVHATDTNTLVRVRVVMSWWLARQAQERESRIRDIHPWPGPNLDPATGRLAWGVAADGGTAYARLWLPDPVDHEVTQGGRHWWFTGRTRGGKTASMQTALLSAVTAGVVYPVVIDMQGGVSLGEWRDMGVPYAEDLDGARRIAQRLLLEGQARVAWMTDPIGNGFGRLLKAWPTPTPRLPAILAVVDEAPALAEDTEAMHTFAKIMREFAKAGILVWWASQTHHAMSAFGSAGGSQAREQMKAGNVSQFSGAVNSRTEVFDVADGGDMQAVTELPRGVAGANQHIGPDHEVPVLCRAFYEPRITKALHEYARIPDYELLDVEDEEPTAGVAPVTAGTAREAVEVLVGSQDRGAVIDTDMLGKALGSRWEPRTQRDAMQAAVDAGLVVKHGRGSWRVL